MDDVIDDVRDYAIYCSSYCSIVCRECVESIAQGDRYHALSKGSLLDASKIKSAPIEAKIGTGMFLTTPDTMAVSVLRENGVITLPHPFYSFAA